MISGNGYKGLRGALLLLLMGAVWSAEGLAQTGGIGAPPTAAAVATPSKPAVASDALAQARIAPKVLAPSLEISNVFDAERKLWPDRVPPPPPTPPPPPPAPVTDADLQLYGVAIAGSVKRATVKIGPRFSDARPSERGFASLIEGQRLGEFTVTSIAPSQVVLAAPGGQQIVSFTKKTDRGAGAVHAAAAPPPVQAPTDSAGSAAAAAEGAVAVPGAAGVPGVPAPRTGPAAVQNTSPDGAAAVAAPVNIQNSLAAAIAAARANAANRPSTNDSLNPFMQKR